MRDGNLPRSGGVYGTVNDPHVSRDLSAYLDAELAPADRARVSAHLEDCARCALQLAELRATATMIAALPSPRPSRSLVPSLAPRWNWLRPVRSLSAMASGAFLMVFLVAAVAQSGSDLGGGPATPFGQTAAQPAAAPTAAEQVTLEAASPPPADVRVAVPVATAQPAPAAGAADGTPAAPAGEQETEDAASAPEERGAAAATAVAADTEGVRQVYGLGSEPLTPLVWLGLAALAALFAAVAHWRLRAA